MRREHDGISIDNPLRFETFRDHLNHDIIKIQYLQGGYRNFIICRGDIHVIFRALDEALGRLEGISKVAGSASQVAHH